MRRVGLVMVAVVLVTACGGDRPNLVDQGLERQVDDPSTTVADQPDRDVLRLAVERWTGDPSDAGPADPGRRVVADLLHEGLTRLDPSGGATPGLAESWNVSADRLTWTFTMVPGAVDSEGAPITARTAMRSLDHVAARGPDDVVGTSLAAVSGWSDRMSGRAGGVAGITAPTDDRLVVRLMRPFEPLLEVLASPALGIQVLDDPTASTGTYRVDRATGELWPVDAESTLPRIALVDADEADGAALFVSGEIDWAPLAGGSATDDLAGDVVRVPLDVWVGLALKTDDAGARRALALAIDPVALAATIGVSPAPPRVPVLAASEVPPAIVIDVPEGALRPLGDALASRFAEVGVSAEVVASGPESFAARVLSGDAVVHPIVLAGGTWSSEAVASGLVPGGVDDLVGFDSVDRTSLGESLTGTRDLENRRLFEDLLVQSAVDDGVLVMVGRVEAHVGVGPAVSGLAHRADGTLDLSGLEISR